MIRQRYLVLYPYYSLQGQFLAYFCPVIIGPIASERLGERNERSCVPRVSSAERLSLHLAPEKDG